MTNTIVNLFVGDPDQEPSERKLILRLRRDLERAGVPATFYANFITVPRQRQLDLFVRVPWRTAQVEIKALDPTLPVIATPNGPWRRRLPDGSERATDGNYGRQALHATFAVSDAMRDLARTGAVRSPSKGDFKSCIDTVLCLWEDIPAGSSIEVPRFVTVTGYAGLLDRLLDRNGPVVPWDDEEWDAFARHLNLYQPEPESEHETRRRVGLEAVADYQSRARAALAAGLVAHVDTGLVASDGTPASVDEVDELLASAKAVVLEGPSGCGKTHLARHLAVRHCDAGRLVIWARCGEYDQGRLGDLLSRSMAPFSARRRRELTERADDAGAGVTLMLDGLDECPDDLRAELLEQVSAFRLRVPGGLLITSTIHPPALDAIGARAHKIGPPDGDARTAILTVHGATVLDRISDAFTSPYELAVAAECETELGDDAGNAQLHDAFIRRFAPNEQVRSGLRLLATMLHDELRSSVPLVDATRMLGTHPVQPCTPAGIDEILRCPLVVVEHHRVQFQHGLLARFLAAEQLVRTAASGDDLGVSLSSPVNEDLRADALAAERDTRRQWQALRQLASVNLFADALAGRFGPEAAECVAAETTALLHRVTSASFDADAVFEPGPWPAARWRTARPLPGADQALLHFAGAVLGSGRFVDEVCALVDRGDVLCARAVGELDAAGHDAPIATAFAATYVQSAARDEHSLPVSFVARGCELRAIQRAEPKAGVAARLAATDDPFAWGRVHLAVQAANPDDPDDQMLFADLLQRAWDSGAYHLRLAALHAAGYFSSSREPARGAIVDVLLPLRSSHWALSTSIVEALARYGEIDSGRTVDDLVAEIKEAISHPDDPTAWKAASGIVSAQFEDEDIVGPYTAAVGALTDTDRVRLLCMAAQFEDWSMHLSWTLEQLAALVPTDDNALDDDVRSVFAAYVNGPPEEAFMPTEAVAVFLASVQGWARFDNALPPGDADAPVERQVWRLLAGLLLRLERSDVVGDPAVTWTELRAVPAVAVNLLAQIAVTARSSWGSRRDVVSRLLAAWPDDSRAVFATVLAHPDTVDGPGRLAWCDPHRFVIDALGDVGTLADIEALRLHLLDPDVGAIATSAIRQIHARLG